MLKETRPPAVVVATRTLSAETGIATVAALVELYRSATESADQPKNVR
jgi:hypothetical protein